jgi:hypothetical protein
VRSKDERNHFSLLPPYFFQRSRIYVVPPSPFTSLLVRSSFRFVRQQAFRNMRAQKLNVEYITCSYSSHVPYPSSLSQTPRWNSAAVYPVESNISLSCRMGVMEYPVPYSETYCRLVFLLHLLHFTSPSRVQDALQRFDRSCYTGS